MVYETPRQEQRAGEQSIRALYESKPYPGLGDKPKDTGNWVRPIRHLLPKGELRYLDAGCGTGHSVVGMAKAFPEWRYHAMDISRPSLDIAVQLAERFGVEVQYGQGSYLDPLPFSGPFDLIACFGSIVVCQDPVRAIRNLLNYLSADGILMLWLYCKEGHEPRMVTKEILSVFEPDVFQHQRRFQLYRELKEKQRPGPISFLLDLSLRRVLRAAHNRLLPEHFRRQSFEYDYTEPDQLWTDNFCIPFEHHHNVLDLKVLAEASGLDVFLLTGQGREDLDLLPAAWREPFRKLDKWSKWRLMELLSYRHPRAMQVYGRRQNSASF
jgi:SAM-dependent methyltransferase